MSRRSRRRRRRGGGAPKKGLRDSSPAALRKLALDHLERGRVREAAQAAKDLLKIDPGPDAEDLLIRTRLARAEELADSGLVHNAIQLLDSLARALPRSREKASDLRISIEAGSGRIDSVLRDLSAPKLDGERRGKLLDLVRDGTMDPRDVAESEALPAGHPLRLEAKAASRVFARATSGSVAGEDREVAGAVPRRSPLSPWVTLARAVQAAYRGEADTFERLARLIPESTPPARLLPMLRALAGNEPGDGLPFSERRLLDDIREESGLAAEIRALEKAFRRGSRGRVQVLGVKIRRRLEAREPGLLPEFRRLFCREWYAAGFESDGLMEILGADPEVLPEIYRYCALALEAVQELPAALECWDAYLDRRGDRAAPEEAALVRLRQAGVAACIAEEWSPGMPDLDDFDPDDVDAFELVEQLLGLRDAEPPPGPRPYLEAAAETFPSDHTFEPLIAHLAEEDPRAAEAAALRWHDADASALGPLFHLVRAAEGRGSVRKALRWLARAEELEPSHPEVREGRFRLLLAGAADRIRREKFHLARKDVAAIEETPRGRDPRIRCLLLGLGWLAAETSDERDRRREELARDLGKGGAALLLGQMRRAVRASPSVPRVRLPKAPPPAEAARALAQVGRCFSSVGWEIEPVPAWAQALRRGLEKGLDPAEPDLEPLCRVMTDWRENHVLYLLSGQGLLRPGSLRHRFLLHRARSLPFFPRERKRRRSCLRAALTLARRSSDPETEKEALAELSNPFVIERGHRFSFLLNPASADAAEPLPAEELAYVLESEANTPPEGSHRRRRPRRRRSAQRGLFDF